MASPKFLPFDHGGAAARSRASALSDSNSCPRPQCLGSGLLSVAEASAASPVVEEHEEHDQVDDRGDGQVDGRIPPLLPLVAVSGLYLSHCPPPLFVSDPFTRTTYE